MSDCCDPIAYRRFFNNKDAQRRLRRYRKGGLDPLAKSMVNFLASQDIAGASLLEVGGGVGDLQVELLKAGVGHATNVELSAGYEETAKEMIAAEGLTDRITRHLGDFVEDQDKFEPADIVVLNRVVCCYPWMDRMMSAATSKTGRYLGLAFPKEKWFMKTTIGLANTFMAATRCDSRAFVHSVDEMESIATRAGLAIRHTDENIGWQAVVYERVSQQGEVPP